MGWPEEHIIKTASSMLMEAYNSKIKDVFKTKNGFLFTDDNHVVVYTRNNGGHYCLMQKSVAVKLFEEATMLHMFYN